MTDPIPPDAVSLSDYQRLATQSLEGKNLAYLNGGSADQHTLKDNCESWTQQQFWPRVLRDFTKANTRSQLLGHALTSPVLIAPTAYHHLFHPEGELATVTAASALGTPYIVSTQASTRLEEIAQKNESASLWFQLYIQHDRPFTERLIRRAEAAGYETIVLTVDAPINGIRNQEQRAGFHLPPHIEAINLRGMSPAPAARSPLDPAFTSSLPTWEDIAWLKSLTTLPLVIKGILHPQDALIAIEHGADALIVSNHGGRTLDLLPSTRSALPLIAAVVREKVPILIDGGIRRGTDVLQALALGASAVLLGRPILHGLSVAGASGVAHVLTLIQHELEVAMLLTGCRNLSEASNTLSPTTL